MLKSPTFLFSQSPLHISTRNLLPQIESTGGGDNRSGVNPVRNPSGALNPVRDLSLNGINPALRGGTPYGAEPGIILKPRCSLRLREPLARRAAGPASGSEEPLARREQRGIISNGVNFF